MMRISGLGRAVALIGLLCGPLQAQEASEAQETPAIDTEAVRWVRAAAQTVAEQPNLAVNWFVSFDEVADGREIVTHVRSGTVLLARGQGYYAYAEQEQGTREFFFDQSVLTVYLAEQNAYVDVPFLGSFDDLADRIAAEYDSALPIWQMLVTDNGDRLLEGVTAAAYLGVKRFAGQTSHHIALSTYDFDLQLWVSDAEQPVPLMMVGTEPYKQGWPQFRAYFSDWDFDPELSEDAFSFVADDDATRLVWPKQDGFDGSFWGEE
ncbi:DUF2092 domain-containing protein [Shimia aestuarii]|uniref:DUF2092 domain-containing protein n=1 Tax=Shimia aestuarii TaxID=254406 RepID=A0A1I4I5X3_9RHOB|nr:DUF2092 domain-containing protein [Shimia aestuarii]SFL49467.1 hypothetical protein SAMN04488042_101433 [Shimia aestuarii]